MKQYGHFSSDDLEYVVTTPHPPRDWFNYFWNSEYLACASQSMNGSSLYQSEAGVVTHLFGRQDQREAPRWVYVRDRDTGEVWSAGRLPCCTEHDEFECVHGLGYSILRSLKCGIRIEFRLFVPRKHSGEIWTIDVTNESRRTRRLSVFCVTDVMLDGLNMPYGHLTGLSAEFIGKENMLFFKNTSHTVVDEKYRAFLFADRRIKRWDLSKDHFLGRSRNYACPERVMEGRLGNSVASAEHMVGAVQHDLNLPPKATRTTNIVLGVVRDLKEAIRMKKAFEDTQRIEKEFELMRRKMHERLGSLHIDTPDKQMNRLFNVWLKHQLYLMADWARFYFKGYRDTCQDAAGMAVLDADRGLQMLTAALRHQRSDGFCPRAFRVPNMNVAAADKHYADSPSWISHATDSLLRETGDLSMLEQQVPYSDRGVGTIWEHNLKAMEFLWSDRGSHGLSLIHHGDWNDLMDRVGHKGRGEGVWMSFALARVLNLVGDMAEARNDRKTAALCRRRFKSLQANIITHGRRGGLFLYAINDDGKAIGDPRGKNGRIFINPQSWAMLSNVISSREYERIASQIEPVVDTPVGPVHHWPPFTSYDKGVGQLSGTTPGFFTNGNVYCHAASFKIAADLKAGRADKAYETLTRILPSPERSEPYAQANGYVGPSALRLQRNVSDDPWRTGTVAWHFLNAIDGLLGFHPVLAGFRLQPKLPSKWKKAEYVREFRGYTFRIQVRRTGRAGISVNGQAIDGDTIALMGIEGLNRRRVVHVECCVV